jgi:hypothetical protein
MNGQVSRWVKDHLSWHNFRYCSSVRMKEHPSTSDVYAVFQGLAALKVPRSTRPSASSMILSDEAKVSLRGRGVFRSSSRNWQYQPCDCMKDM